MDDMDAIWGNSLEGDFIDLVKKNFVPSLFMRSAERMLGSEWRTDGESLLKENAPELLPNFKKYADKSPDKQD